MSKKGGRGGGSSPIQKKSLQIYAYLTDFLEKAQCNFQKKDGAGVKAVWNFSKKTSIFEPTVVPKSLIDFLVGPTDIGRYRAVSATGWTAKNIFCCIMVFQTLCP